MTSFYLILQLYSLLIISLDNMLNILLDNSNNLTNYLILLSCIIIPITLLITNSLVNRNFIYLLGLILIISFSTMNIIIWYISFEIIIIPMVFLISKGSASLISRYRAIYRFVLYTILGGVLLLCGLLPLIIVIGSYNYYSIINNSLSLSLQIVLFPIILTSYLIKLPIIPFHIWLPDTHGEAPTAGSVILAALLLKLGGLGIIRWLIPILPYGYLYYRPLLIIIGGLSSIYASFTTLRHIDIKKLIAYSSIAHMGFILMGLGSLSYLSIINFYGVILLLLSHGLVSSLLFLLIGSIYVRTGTRYLIYYRGLATTMPIFTIILFITLILNAAIPPSLPFFSEFLILQGTFLHEIFLTTNVLLSVLISGIYSIMLFCKIAYNNVLLYKYTDLTFKEFSLFLPLIIFSLLFSFIL